MSADITLTVTPYRQPIFRGDVGRDVTAVKRALLRMKAPGRQGIVVTDRAGGSFVACLKALQEAHAIEDTGNYGPRTHALVSPHFDLYGALLYRTARLRARRAPGLALSTPGAAFIGAWEGYRARVYADSSGNATIGIGWKLHDGPPTAADERLVWSYAYAEQKLQQYVAVYLLPTIKRAIRVPLLTCEVDALCCLGFNTGPGSLEPDHAVAAAVNAKPELTAAEWYGRVRAAIMLWSNPRVLERRRESEAYLFQHNAYTVAGGNPYANS